MTDEIEFDASALGLSASQAAAAAAAEADLCELRRLYVTYGWIVRARPPRS